MSLFRRRTPPPLAGETKRVEDLIRAVREHTIRTELPRHRLIVGDHYVDIYPAPGAAWRRVTQRRDEVYGLATLRAAAEGLIAYMLHMNSTGLRAFAHGLWIDVYPKRTAFAVAAYGPTAFPNDMAFEETEPMIVDLEEEKPHDSER